MSSSDIHNRKTEHLTLARDASTQMRSGNGLDRIRFEPISLPEIDFSDIRIDTTFLGKSISAPIMIASMSGGTKESEKLNERLAVAAQAMQIPLALGSMRIALEQPALRQAFQLRHVAPSIPILANIGGAQLIEPNGIKRAIDCVDIASADALIVHLNPLQEALQPKGDRNWRGVSQAIKIVAEESPVPVIVKEVGHGLGPVSVSHLMELGISWIDLAGTGGTSWAMIETLRAGDTKQAMVGSVFADFGISAAETLHAISRKPEKYSSCRFIASGGIRSGLDVARALRAGATLCSAAKPFLDAADKGPEAIESLVATWCEQLRVTCFVTGSPDIESLKCAPLLHSE
jgi:isopentenyl-diphosphate delta-isomerase